MRIEFATISKQLSQVASKLLSSTDISAIERDIVIYSNFLNQLLDIAKNGIESDEQALLSEIEKTHNKLISHLKHIQIGIKSQINQKIVQISTSNKFKNFTENPSIFDKKT